MGLEGAMYLRNRELFTLLLLKGAAPTDRDLRFAKSLEDKWFLEELNKAPTQPLEPTVVPPAAQR